MPKPSQSWFKRFFYNQNIKRDKSGKKYKNLIDHTITLIKRLEKEGMTKWMANALNKSQAKIKSYGITLAQMVSALEHKGLGTLEALLNSNLVFVQKKWHNVSISTKRDVIPTVKKIVASGNTKKATTEKKEATKKPAASKKTTTEKKVAVVKKETTKKEAPKKATTKKTTTTKKPTTKKAA